MPTHVVLVYAKIHWNTGNTGRTCLATGATFHLIESLGFSFRERELGHAVGKPLPRSRGPGAVTGV